MLPAIIVIFFIWAVIGFIVGTVNFFDKVYPSLLKMNILYSCDNCNRYSRKYHYDLRKNIELEFNQKDNQIRAQMNKELRRIFSSTDDTLCPHCSNALTEKSDSSYRWLKTHRDAPQVTLLNYLRFSKAKETASLLMYEELAKPIENRKDSDAVYCHLLDSISKE